MLHCSKELEKKGFKYLLSIAGIFNGIGVDFKNSKKDVCEYVYIINRKIQIIIYIDLSSI